MSPVARHTDPETSWEAADSVEHIRASQKAILTILKEGPLTDIELIAEYEIRRHYVSRDDYPRQSESGIRTRRSELVGLGLVGWTGGHKVLISGRRARLWAAKSQQRSEVTQPKEKQ